MFTLKRAFLGSVSFFSDNRISRYSCEATFFVNNQNHVTSQSHVIRSWFVLLLFGWIICYEYFHQNWRQRKWVKIYTNTSHLLTRKTNIKNCWWKVAWSVLYTSFALAFLESVSIQIAHKSEVGVGVVWKPTFTLCCFGFCRIWWTSCLKLFNVKSLTCLHIFMQNWRQFTKGLRLVFLLDFFFFFVYGKGCFTNIRKLGIQ